VRGLIPNALPGTTMEDEVTARLNYGALDDAAHPVRIRLNSTVVRAKHNGDAASARDVTVTYVRGDKPYRVKAQSVILACYNAIIPFLCP
jgi:spermidine dehydrogenase